MEALHLREDGFQLGEAEGKAVVGLDGVLLLIQELFCVRVGLVRLETSTKKPLPVVGLRRTEEDGVSGIIPDLEDFLHNRSILVEDDNQFDFLLLSGVREETLDGGFVFGGQGVSQIPGIRDVIVVGVIDIRREGIVAEDIKSRVGRHESRDGVEDDNPLIRRPTVFLIHLEDDVVLSGPFESVGR